MATPLSVFNCTMTTRAESQLLLIINKQERTESDLQIPRWICKAGSLKAFSFAKQKGEK